MVGGKAGYAERPTSGLEGRGKETDTRKGTPRLPLTLDPWMLDIMALTQAKRDLSPRARELLANLWYNFSICSGELQEGYERAMELARRSVEGLTKAPLSQTPSAEGLILCSRKRV